MRVPDALSAPDTCSPPTMDEDALERKPLIRPRESMTNTGLFAVDVETTKSGCVWLMVP